MPGFCEHGSEILEPVRGKKCIKELSNYKSVDDFLDIIIH
jgi:hypothetical protein